MNIDRSKNPPLSELKMVTTGQSKFAFTEFTTLEYSPKHDDSESEGRPTFLTEKHLNNLVSLKEYYHIYDEDGVGQPYKSPTSEQLEAGGDALNVEFIVRSNFEKRDKVKKQIDKAMRELFTQEYTMIKLFRP